MSIPEEHVAEFVVNVLEAVVEAQPSLLPPEGCGEDFTATCEDLGNGRVEIRVVFDSEVNPDEKIMVQIFVDVPSVIPPLPYESREWPKTVYDPEWGTAPTGSYTA